MMKMARGIKGKMKDRKRSFFESKRSRKFEPENFLLIVDTWTRFQRSWAVVLCCRSEALPSDTPSAFDKEEKRNIPVSDL